MSNNPFGDDPVNFLGQPDANGTRRVDDRLTIQGQRVPAPKNPNVLNSASSFTLSQTSIQGGALSAVGGQQRIRIKGRKPSRNNGQINPGHYASGTGVDVLSDFGGGTLPAATYGVGSFSAVRGYQDMRRHNKIRDPESLSSTAIYTPRPNVLPNVDGSSIPGPVNGHYADGQYSAIAGYQSDSAPSVLNNFKNFNGDRMDIRAGAFSAIAMDQIIEYDHDEGDERETLDSEHRYRE
ncbi:hypothetical protein GYMLUDRAFT_43407 [Collybiopsis luxurians FD-317 M1]|uniref:Uncharacterized protein n=1 Tax=Collybiopsis luxurians FD-317 M1 TaxID=944289 RepID=A0A0D0CPJ5_9AGAR|nr:hypothetical protein GYMLUDRAFT_43407 [Collybiopsis luxurians FD-317 M1]